MSRPNFGQMFKQSKGAPVDYNGKRLIMLDRIPVNLGERLLVTTIESTRADWPQGVGISEGQVISKEKGRRDPSAPRARRTGPCRAAAAPVLPSEPRDDAWEKDRAERAG